MTVRHKPFYPGQKFGRLTLVSSYVNNKNRSSWRCVCECGKKVFVKDGSINNGHVRSCGCLRRECNRRYKPFEPKQTVARLTLLFKFRKNGILFWRSLCECGTRTTASDGNIRSGNVKSCGCLLRETAAARHTTHGESKKTPEWLAWKNMIDRCENPDHQAFKNYGMRGITVCRAWRRSYVAFLKDVGRRPSKGHTLNRIENNKGYCPSNVNWATWGEQGRNRRNNVFVTINGISKTVSEWSRVSKINVGTLWVRLKKGWDPKEAINKPVNRNISRQSKLMHKTLKINRKSR